MAHPYARLVIMIQLENQNRPFLTLITGLCKPSGILELRECFVLDGYAGKILYVDLTSGVSRTEPLPEKMAEDFLG
jgi:hypothetical protein